MDIDFYILDTASKQQAWLFACTLAEKAHADNQSVFIYTATQDEAERMDALMWTYRDDSFLPHQLVNESTTSPILIGSDLPQTDTINTMINLHQTLPKFYGQFKRIIEIVTSEPQAQTLARERYRLYRDAGHNLQTHKLKVNAS
jgi:DNA polymerase-3 subunit chi